MATIYEKMSHFKLTPRECGLKLGFPKWVKLPSCGQKKDQQRAAKKRVGIQKIGSVKEWQSGIRTK